MFKLFVLPTAEDQAAFASGIKPDQAIHREFESELLRDDYNEGFVTVAGFPGCSVEEETEMTLRLLVEGEEENWIFDHVETKEAFKLGMADATGLRSPQVIDNTDRPLEYAKLQALLGGEASEGCGGVSK